MVLSSDAIDRRLRAMPVGTAQPINLDPTMRAQPVGTAQPIGMGFERTTQPITQISAPTPMPKPPPPPARYGQEGYNASSPMSSAIDPTRPNYQNVDQFDFNRGYEDQLDQLQRQRADLERENDLENQRMNEDYGRQFRDVRYAQDEALGLDAERMASQGILRSGIAVKSAGEIGARYGGELDTLQRQLSGQLENRGAAYAQAQRQIQEQIGRAQEAVTRQQQQLEEQRARQLAAAQAAQQAAETAAQQMNPSRRIILDNRGQYRLVDTTNNTYQTIASDSVDKAIAQFGGVTSGLENANEVLRNDNYIPSAEAYSRRFGHNQDNHGPRDAMINPTMGYRVAPGGQWRG